MRKSSPAGLSVSTQIATILTLFTWIISPLRRGHGFTWWEITASLLNIPSSHTLVSAVIMVVMTSALITRKRAALYAVIFFQVIGITLSGKKSRSALRVPMRMPMT